MDHESAITKVGNLAAASMEMHSSCGGPMPPTGITQEPEPGKRYEIGVVQNPPTQITHEPELACMDHAEARTRQYESRKTPTSESFDSHGSYHGANSYSSILLENVKVHPPLGATASVETGGDA